MSGLSLRLSQFKPDTPIQIDAADATIEMSVNDVLQWVAPGAPPSEALMFLLTCRSARLNPFLKEAYLIQVKDKWTTIIAKAGYLKRAQADPNYDGHEAGILAREFDPATRRAGEIQALEGTFLPPGWIVVGGWAKVYRKSTSRPVSKRVSIAEYGRDSYAWKVYACTMIEKVALVAAIREAFAIGDSYDEAEVGEATTPTTMPASAVVIRDAEPTNPSPPLGSLPAPQAPQAPQVPLAPEAPPYQPIDLITTEEAVNQSTLALLRERAERAVNSHVITPAAIREKIESFGARKMTELRQGRAEAILDWLSLAVPVASDVPPPVPSTGDVHAAAAVIEASIQSAGADNFVVSGGDAAVAPVKPAPPASSAKGKAKDKADKATQERGAVTTA